jgi:phosphomannomutase
VKDIVAKYGGTAIMTVSATPSSEGCARPTPSSAEGNEHYYFRDNFYADNGFIPALLMLELMSKKGQSLHDLLKPLAAKYFISGEINTKLPSMDLVPAKLEQIAAKYRDGRQFTLDGLSVEYPDWHFNVRPSNTEPLLRLNLETLSQEMMEKRRDEVLALIRS